jgi:hypothetical protein
MKILFNVLVATAAFAFFPKAAIAEQFKCACAQSAVAAIDGMVKGDNKFSCAGGDIYDQAGTGDRSVQETFVKIKVDKSEQIQSDSDMQLDIRPRDGGNCIWAVNDGNAKKKFTAKNGSHCSDWKRYGPFKISKASDAEFSDQGVMTKPEQHNIKYQIETTEKKYDGTVIFAKNPVDGKKQMIAACLQDK